MNPNSNASISKLAARATFVVLLLALSYAHLTILFRGLSTEEGMEQAVIGREVARGNGLQTKVIRPSAIRLARENNNEKASLDEAKSNTYFAPLQPILLGTIFKLQGAVEFQSIEDEEMIYGLDRTVALFSIICFFLGITMTYFLVGRIFDSRIAASVAFMMLFCSLFWDFATSGMAQMLMLFLFSTGSYFAYRALENSEEEQNGLIFGSLAALFFALLAVTHYLAIWIMVGYAVAAAIFIQPKGFAGIIAFVTLILALILPIGNNISTTGTVGGLAFLDVYEGLQGQGEIAQRSLGPVVLNLGQIPLRLTRLALLQTENLYLFLGSIIAAPAFFVALLHNFKKPSIANFRWVLFLMWICAAFGMGIFGLKNGAQSYNQLHILFAPLMAAYGLALITVLWGRLDIFDSAPFLRNAHLIVLVAISAGPYLLKTPFDAYNLLKQGNSNQQFPPNYPPYAPSVLDDSIVAFSDEEEIVFTDQPAAVAWYTDRPSILLPFRLESMEELEDMADAEGRDIAGTLITPKSNGERTLSGLARNYGDYLSIMLDGWAASASGTGDPRLVSRNDKDMQDFFGRYPYTNFLLFQGDPMIYYSSRRLDK